MASKILAIPQIFFQLCAQYTSPLHLLHLKAQGLNDARTRLCLQMAILMYGTIFSSAFSFL